MKRIEDMDLGPTSEIEGTAMAIPTATENMGDNPFSPAPGGEMSEEDSLPLNYDEGGMVEDEMEMPEEMMVEEDEGDEDNMMPSLAELIRQQGEGEDTVLAHITPQESALLAQLSDGGSINPITGLPQFGFFGNLFSAGKKLFSGLGGRAGVGNILGNVGNLVGGFAGNTQNRGAQQALGGFGGALGGFGRGIQSGSGGLNSLLQGAGQGVYGGYQGAMGMPSYSPFNAGSLGRGFDVAGGAFSQIGNRFPNRFGSAMSRAGGAMQGAGGALGNLPQNTRAFGANQAMTGLKGGLSGMMNRGQMGSGPALPPVPMEGRPGAAGGMNIPPSPNYMPPLPPRAAGNIPTPPNYIPQGNNYNHLMGRLRGALDKAYGR